MSRFFTKSCERFFIGYYCKAVDYVIKILSNLLFVSLDLKRGRVINRLTRGIAAL